MSMVAFTHLAAQRGSAQRMCERLLSVGEQGHFRFMIHGAFVRRTHCSFLVGATDVLIKVRRAFLTRIKCIDFKRKKQPSRC